MAVVKEDVKSGEMEAREQPKNSGVHVLSLLWSWESKTYESFMLQLIFSPLRLDSSSSSSSLSACLLLSVFPWVLYRRLSKPGVVEVLNWHDRAIKEHRDQYWRFSCFHCVFSTSVSNTNTCSLIGDSLSLGHCLCVSVCRLCLHPWSHTYNSIK